jgi:hypothetical protein
MKYIILNFSLFALIFLLISCNRDDTNNEPKLADAPTAKYLFDAIKDEVDQQLNFQESLNGFKADNSGVRGGCANVTIAPQGNTFPKTVTIVFPQNCTTFAGASIEGTIIVTISGKVREAGTTAKFSLSDFKYKSFTISGDYFVEINSPVSHTTKISNGKIVTTDGKIITYSATNSATQTAGTNTTFRTNPSNFMQDDVYAISTSSQGINSNGNAFSVSTDDVLIYKVACQWVTSGKLTVVEESRPKVTASLDYGDGICDNKAMLTFNKVTLDIELP